MATDLSSQRVDSDDLEFIDRALVGWARWASDESGPNKPSEAGRVLSIAFVREGEYTLRLTDDEFTMLDSHIAVLNDRLRQIVELEYRNYWRGRRHLMTQEEKWRRLGLHYIAYGARLDQAKESIFRLVEKLLDHYLDLWRKRKK